MARGRTSIAKLSSPLIARQHGNLAVLAKAKPAERKKVLKNANGDLIKAICECLLNVCRGNVHLPARCLNRLKRHKSTWRKLIDKKHPLKKKKKLLIQKGGFLPAFLLPVLASLGSALVSKFAG